MSLPRYYDKLAARQEGESALQERKAGRVVKARKHRANNTPERLAARLEVAESKKKARKEGCL